MLVPNGAPPLALFVDWVGLKTRSYQAARARIDGLLDVSADVTCTEAELTVLEPSSRGLFERLVGVNDGTVMCGGRDAPGAAAAVAALGHVHDAVAAEAWARFGAPQRAGGWKRDDQFQIEWQWRATGAVAGPPAIDAWSPFVAAHDQLMYGDISSRVCLHASWELRLTGARGRVVPVSYPRSEIRVMLRARRAQASLALVLPHDAATPAFRADADAVDRALGLTLNRKRYKLNADKKKGSGRSDRKLPEP